MIKRFLAIGMLVILAIYALQGLSVQPFADDLAFIQLAKYADPLTQQYYGWSGRYSATLLLGYLLPLAPNMVVKLFPALWILSGVGMAYALNKRRVRYPLLMAGGLVVAFLWALPDLFESFFWFAGSVNYLTPLWIFGILWLYLSRSASLPLGSLKS